MTEPPEILIAQVAWWVPILPCPPGEKSAGGLCHLEEVLEREVQAGHTAGSSHLPGGHPSDGAPCPPNPLDLSWMGCEGEHLAPSSNLASPAERPPATEQRGSLELLSTFQKGPRETAHSM